MRKFKVPVVGILSFFAGLGILIFVVIRMCIGG